MAGFKKLLILIIALALAGVCFFYLKQHSLEPKASGVKPAVQISRAEAPQDRSGIEIPDLYWGMNRKEVERVLGKALAEAPQTRKFYSPRNPIASAQAQTFRMEGQAFLGKESDYVFLFLGDKLAAYYIFIKGFEPDELDDAMRSFLIKKFGETYVVPADPDQELLKMIWQKKTLTVNYWVFKEELTMTQKACAGFGVINHQIEESL